MQTTFLPTPTGLTETAPAQARRAQNKVKSLLNGANRIAEQLNAALYATKATDRPTIHSPADAAAIIHPFLAYLDHEEMWVLCLDTRNRVVAVTKLYQGSVNSSQVRVGEIFREAIQRNSPSIIVAHNHPSGDASPSPDDVAVTRAIVQAGKLLNVDVLDHLIISGATLSTFTSMKEKGLGFA